MTALSRAYDLRVRIGGTVTDVLSARTLVGAEVPISTASIDLALPLPSQVDDGADVTVEVARDGVYMPTLFTGTFRNPDRNYSVSGKTASLTCEGPNYLLAYPFERDVVYAGGARNSAVSLFTTARHLGDDTVTWYAIDAPTGLTSDVTVTPGADSHFVWVAGRIHGSNSYDASIGDKTIRDPSKIIVRQTGVEIGHANLPVANEQWTSELDYTVDANWTDFEVFIAANIVAADGDITFRFYSGHKPGSTDRDEYEVKNVTWQTAGRTSVRNIVRGLYKRAGFAPGTYSVNEITDLDGITVVLGGNGLVDQGQVRMGAADSPLTFATRILDLFGFNLFDRANGVPAVRPFRGAPDAGESVATFAEGVSAFSFRRPAIDPRTVYNAVRVDGASGANQNRKRFAYLYETASPLPHALIPVSVGVNKLRLSNRLLVSDTLCEQAGAEAEETGNARTFVEWETWPQGAIDPMDVVTVTSPTVEYDGPLFATRIAHDLSPSGFRCSMTGWAGTSHVITETPDPDDEENDEEPTDPRDTFERRPYRPSAEVES